MIAIFVVAAAVGLGIHLLSQGLFPPKPTLAERVRRLVDAQPEPNATELDPPTGLQGRVERRLGPTLVGLFATAGADSGSRSRQQDLRVTGTRMESLMTEKAMLAVTGAAFPWLLGGGLALADVRLPVPLLFGLSVMLMAGGFILPESVLRRKAAERRKSFRYALSAFLDLVAISLAGGGPVQGSLLDAASVGRGWAFDEFRRPLATTRTSGRPPWQDLGRLGDDLGVPELEELAASLSLAGAEGARVRQSLTAKAESLRQRRMTEAEGEANQSSERMVLPLVLLGLGFLLFLGYPAVSRVLGGF